MKPAIIKSHVFFDLIWNILKRQLCSFKIYFLKKRDHNILAARLNAYCDIICNSFIIKSARILAVASK